MNSDAAREDLGEILAPPSDDKATRDFHIARRTDGRWEVECSKARHKRIYDSLIDAAAGAMEMAAADSGPYSIRIGR